MIRYTCICAFAVSCLFLSLKAFAQVVSTDTDFGKALFKDPKITTTTWKAEDYATALPLALPLVEATVKEMKERGARAPKMAIAAFSTAYQGPQKSVAQKPKQMCDKSALPQIDIPDSRAAGTRGAYFSSSRLIPTSARLFFPYSVSGKIFFRKSDGRRFICSGTVIHLRLVVTAGHCVHSGTDGNNGFYQDIIFVPAWHEGEAPFGTWQAKWVATTKAWATGNGVVPNSGDFAIFEVADQEIDGEVSRIGEITGFLGFRTNGLLKNHVKILGYPGSFDDGNIMHQVDSGDSAAAANNTVLYGSDMTGGSSGGSWIQNFGEKADGQPDAIDGEMNLIVGITSFGFVSSEPKVQGSSTPNDAFVELYNMACSHDSRNCKK